MCENILYQILLGVLIIGGVFLIMVLWKLYQVLLDVRSATVRVSKRVEQIDNMIDIFGEKMKGIGSVVAGFVTSVLSGKKVKEVVEDFWSKK